MNSELIYTETPNPRTRNIDTLNTAEILELINDEDAKVALAVRRELGNISRAVDAIVERMERGGRLIYTGCGTSGRLGVLDAVECPPTYSTDPDQVIGILAGGEKAMFRAVEGAEDNAEMGESDLRAIHLTADDVTVGLAASGQTPYVLGAIAYANSIGSCTVGVSCCPGSKLSVLAQIAITPVPGPEVVTGSTRMKSGTAQKMVLNMLSTCAMIRLGKVYGNLMVDVQPSNQKLIHRSQYIVSQATNTEMETAAAALEKCGYQPKVAIVMLLKGVDPDQARDMLRTARGRVSRALEFA